MPLEHLALGTEVEPGAVPRCADVLRLADTARNAGGELLAARTGQAPLALPLGDAERGGGLVPSAVGDTYLEPSGAGEFALDIEVPQPGRYEIWLGGSLRPSARLSIDGEEVSTLRQQLNTPGSYLDFGVLPLQKGMHRFVVVVGGPDLHPGSAGADGPLGPLVIARPGADRRLPRFAPEQASQLCGETWDWIEAVPSR